MSEHDSSGQQPQLLDRFLDEVRGYVSPGGLEICQDAGLVIAANYGIGEPADAALPNNRAYHCLPHAVKTGRWALMFAKLAELSPRETEVSILGGVCHDIVHGNGRGEDEWQSAEWLKSRMQDQGYATTDVDTAVMGILGTEPHFDGEAVAQQVQMMDFPGGAESTARVVAQCIASADLVGLFSPLGPLLGHRLYQEEQHVSIKEEPPLFGLTDFHARQSRILDTYTPPLSKANRLFSPFRDVVSEYTRQIGELVAAGQIQNWKQIIRCDAYFARTTKEAMTARMAYSRAKHN
jgi:hypothetical protein